MAVNYNPRIVTDGLVLAFDIGNGIKNATGNISTNLVQNGNFANGANSPQEGDSNPTNTIVQLPNPGDTSYVLRQNGNNTEYQLNLGSGMVANTTYVMSGWYAKSADYNGGDTMFHARTYSSSGAHIATGNDTGTLIYSTVVNNITWEFRYQTIATPADFSGSMLWFVGYGTNNTTGYRYYTNLRVEKGTYPSIFNLLGTGNNGECVNGLSYSGANGGSLSFDGSNDYIECGNSSIFNFTNTTISCWFKKSHGSGYKGLVDKGRDGYGAWSLNVDEVGNAATFKARISGISRAITASYQYGNNIWTNIVGVYDGTNLSIYENGVLSNSAQYSGTMDTNSVSVRIGAANDGLYYSGNIAQVSIYNRALTAAEIQQNFNANRSRFGI